MTKVPSLGYEKVINVLKLTVAAHRPIKRSTLAHILKQARMTVQQLQALL